MAADLVIDVENTPGALARVADAISDAGVNIAAATCVGTGDRAELHILVKHAEAAKHALAIWSRASARWSSSTSRTSPACSPISRARSRARASISISCTSPLATAWSSGRRTFQAFARRSASRRKREPGSTADRRRSAPYHSSSERDRPGGRETGEAGNARIRQMRALRLVAHLRDLL